MTSSISAYLSPPHPHGPKQWLLVSWSYLPRLRQARIRQNLGFLQTGWLQVARWQVPPVTILKDLDREGEG